MTNNEILTTFEGLVDDSLDQVLELSLAEQARIELEVELRLQISKKVDTSRVTIVGGSYLTPYSMPADALVPAGQRIYVGSDPYIGIPFEDRMAYKDTNGFFYVDLANNNLYLCGTQNSVQTITFPYITSGTSIGADDNTVLKYPTGFHILVPMKMAMLFYAIDQGDKSRDWSPEWLGFYKMTKNNLIDWDAQWKLAAIGGATPPSNVGSVSPFAIHDLP